MKTLTRVTLAALAALLCARAGAAQGAGAWVKVTPEGKRFVVWMPKQPASQPEQTQAGELKVSGRRYAAAGDDQTSYLVWSLNDPASVGDRLSAQDYRSELFRGEALYLDQVAELAWELLVRPEVERLKNEKPPEGKKVYAGMIYDREFELDGSPAREYSVRLEKRSGPVYVCADREQIYVVAALGADAQAPQLRQFVESFGLKTDAPSRNIAPPILPVNPSLGPGPGRSGAPPATMDVDPMLIKPDPRDIPYGSPNSTMPAPPSGPATGGGGAPVDYNKPFRVSEVTWKARVTFKPEPGFTEGARKFQVSGVVRIRAIFAATGEVTNIVVVKGLPHGLTWRALDAAKKIKFEPAQKDGHVVSQYIVLEYYFNIY